MSIPIAKDIYRKIMVSFMRLGHIIYSSHKKALMGKCGKDVGIFGHFTLINPRQFSIGDDCSINHNVYINCFSPIAIGNDVTLSADVKIISTGIDYKSWVSTGKKSHLKGQDIFIGDYVWIGSGATILGGVHITGKYVVIAAGAVVTKNIEEDHVIYGGCPARLIKKIDN